MTEDKVTTDSNQPISNERSRAIIPEHRPNHILRTILIIAVIGLGIWIWDATKYRFFPKRFGVVEQGKIYRSGQLHPALVEKTLRKYGIQVVISLTGDVPQDPFQAAENTAVEKLGLEFKRFPLMGDGTGDLDSYVKAIEAVIEAKEEGKPVLVHCAAGAQRTGGTFAFYRLLVEGRDPDFVYRELRKYKWRDKPDAPLIPYLNKHMQEVAERLMALGILNRIPDPLPKLTSKHKPTEPSPENRNP